MAYSLLFNLLLDNRDTAKSLGEAGSADLDCCYLAHPWRIGSALGRRPFPSNISNASIGFSGQITPLNFPDLDPGGYTSLSPITNTACQILDLRFPDQLFYPNTNHLSQ